MTLNHYPLKHILVFLPVSLIISSSSDNVVKGADFISKLSSVTSDAKLENAAFS